MSADSNHLNRAHQQAAGSAPRRGSFSRRRADRDLVRCGAGAARRPHTPEDAGASPATATNSIDRRTPAGRLIAAAEERDRILEARRLQEIDERDYLRAQYERLKDFRERPAIKAALMRLAEAGAGLDVAMTARVA